MNISIYNDIQDAINDKNNKTSNNHIINDK